MGTHQTHRLGEPGCVAVDDGASALRRLIARSESGPAGGDDQPAEPVAHAGQRGGDLVGTVHRHLMSDHLETSCGQLLDERPPAGVLTRSGDDSVTDRQHLGEQRGDSRLGHWRRRYWHDPRPWRGPRQMQRRISSVGSGSSLEPLARLRTGAVGELVPRISRWPSGWTATSRGLRSHGGNQPPAPSSELADDVRQRGRPAAGRRADASEPRSLADALPRNVVQAWPARTQRWSSDGGRRPIESPLLGAQLLGVRHLT